MGSTNDIPLLPDAREVGVKVSLPVPPPFKDAVRPAYQPIIRDVQLLQLGAIPLQHPGNRFQAVVREVKSLQGRDLEDLVRDGGEEILADLDVCQEGSESYPLGREAEQAHTGQEEVLLVVALVGELPEEVESGSGVVGSAAYQDTHHLVSVHVVEIVGYREKGVCQLAGAGMRGGGGGEGGGGGGGKGGGGGGE